MKKMLIGVITAALIAIPFTAFAAQTAPASVSVGVGCCTDLTAPCCTIGGFSCCN